MPLSRDDCALGISYRTLAITIWIGVGHSWGLDSSYGLLFGMDRGCRLSGIRKGIAWEPGPLVGKSPCPGFLYIYGAW